MRTTVTIQDVRSLLSRAKNATAFSSKVSLEDVAKNLREFLEIFELVFSRVEKLEEVQRKNKEYEAELKKLRQELDRVKVGLHNVARAVKNGKD